MKQLYYTKPESFIPAVNVVGCYIEVKGQFLLLQKSHNKRQANMWGVPGGKIESNETPEQAIRRELIEETGIIIESHISLDYFGILYIRIPETDYAFHIFKISLDVMPPIHLSHEHQAYAWVSQDKMQTMNLMFGEFQALTIVLDKSKKIIDLL